MSIPTESGLSFCSHSEVLQYLKDYAAKFNIDEKVQLNSEVEKLECVDNQWQVTSNEKTVKFDFVVVANGHYSKPDIPSCFNNHIFQGQSIHASEYSWG